MQAFWDPLILFTIMHKAWLGSGKILRAFWPALRDHITSDVASSLWCQFWNQWISSYLIPFKADQHLAYRYSITFNHPGARMQTLILRYGSFRLLWSLGLRWKVTGFLLTGPLGACLRKIYWLPSLKSLGKTHEKKLFRILVACLFLNLIILFKL